MDPAHQLRLGLLRLIGERLVVILRAERPGAALAQLDTGVPDLLDHPPPGKLETLCQRLELGLQHEQQHQELLLMDLLYNFSLNPLAPAYRDDLPAVSEQPPAPLRWHSHAGGLVEIGHAGDGFAFDCERPRHKVWLEPFRLASRPVSNAEAEDLAAARPAWDRLSFFTYLQTGSMRAHHETDLAVSQEIANRLGLRHQTIDLSGYRPDPTLIATVVRFDSFLKSSGETQIIMTTGE